MRSLAFALPFLAATAAAWADDLGLPPALSIDTPRGPYWAIQDTVQEDPEQDEEAGPSQPFLEYVTFHSELDGGLLYTNFGGGLDLETDTGAYLRWTVDLGGNATVHVAYRHYDFESSEATGGHEHVLIRGFLAGVGYREEIASGVEVSGLASAGLMKWESTDSAFRDEPGYVASGELGLSIRLHEAMRLRIGGAGDWVKTDFHQSSTRVEWNLSGLIGFEIRG